MHWQNKGQRDVEFPHPLKRSKTMAVDKRGRKLPKGIQQRYNGYEARPMIDGK